MPSFPWVGRSGLGFLLVPFGFPQSFIQLGTSPNRKNLEVLMGIKINVLWDILISARHESGVVSWSNLVPLGVMWEGWESSGRREGPEFCLWPDHSFCIPLYLSLVLSLHSLNSEPTTYNDIKVLIMSFFSEGADTDRRGRGYNGSFAKSEGALGDVRREDKGVSSK